MQQLCFVADALVCQAEYVAINMNISKITANEVVLDITSLTQTFYSKVQNKVLLQPFQR